MIDSDAQDSAEGLASEEQTNEISPTKMKQKKQQLRQNQLIRENRQSPHLLQSPQRSMNIQV